VYGEIRVNPWIAVVRVVGVLCVRPPSVAPSAERRYCASCFSRIARNSLPWRHSGSLAALATR
jgi:hypothetical protein